MAGTIALKHVYREWAVEHPNFIVSAWRAGRAKPTATTPGAHPARQSHEYRSPRIGQDSQPHTAK